MMNITINMDLLSTVEVINSANTIVGIAEKISARRMITSSTRPL